MLSLPCPVTALTLREQPAQRHSFICSRLANLCAHLLTFVCETAAHATAG